MILLLLVLLLIPLLVYFVHIKPRKYFKDNGCAYRDSAPIFGEMLPVVLRKTSMPEMTMRIYNESKQHKMTGIFMFVDPTFFVTDPELIKLIGVKYFDKFVNHRPMIPKEVDPLIGNSLLALNDDDWRSMRNHLSPAFTGAKMRSMMYLMDHCANQLLEHLQQKMETDSKDVLEIEIKELFARYTNDVIATCAFGIEVDSYKRPQNDFYLMAKRIAHFSGFRGLKLFLASLSPKLIRMLRLRFFDKEEEAFYRRNFLDVVGYRLENKVNRPDMIHLLMQARKGKIADDADQQISDNNDETIRSGLRDDEMIAQAVVFLFAGFDTSSTLISYVCHELCINQDIQNKLYEEILSVVGKNDGKITYENLNKMVYLDNVVSESLRKWPPFPLTDRTCTTSCIIDCKGSSYKFDQGIVVQFPIMGIQRDPEYFPNPDKFDPERFNDDNKNTIPTGAYIPFGIGPRFCIGSRFALLEVKLVLVATLMKFKMVPISRTEKEPTINKVSFTLLPKDGMWVGFQKRVTTEI